ncbi:MAG: class I SAM-dependent methyltransferase [Chloroflexi bacterium]|nr:MAG: class I SAM-dependent methyltransferase [Chloroflexota bacterium]
MTKQPAKPDDTVWQTADLTQTYLKGIRSAIPLAQEQINVMLRLIRAACPKVTAVLDLGCGDGILGHAILNTWPDAQGVFLDFSAPMLQAAAKRLANMSERVVFVQTDYGQRGWKKLLPITEYDVIVSGYSIHHQPDRRKRELYAELFHLLKPGGIFVNVEHVASRSKWGEKVFDEHFIDALYDFHRRQGSAKSREEIAQIYYNRPDKAANILTPVEIQCDWLRELGFVHVDCYLKIFELAVFAGIKPS